MRLADRNFILIVIIIAITGMIAGMMKDITIVINHTTIQQTAIINHL